SACWRYRSIHLVMRSSTSASRWQGRRCASRRRLTSPASSSTLRCLEIAWTETSYGAASWPTVASPTASRATMSRLVGSARAENPLERRSSATTPPHSLSTDRLSTRLRWHGSVVNQLVGDVPAQQGQNRRGPPALTADHHRLGRRFGEPVESDEGWGGDGRSDLPLYGNGDLTVDFPTVGSSLTFSMPSRAGRYRCGCAAAAMRRPPPRATGPFGAGPP